MTLTGNHWDYDTSFYHYVYGDDERMRRSERETSQTQLEQFDFAIFAAKMDELDKIFMEGKRANDLGMMNATVYTAQKLLHECNVELTQAQGIRLVSVLQQWQKQTDDTLLAVNIAKAVGVLVDKIQYAGSDSVRCSYTVT